MEETYGLREYFEIAWKQKKIIMAVTLITISISAVVSFFVLEPVYESGTSLIINRIENETERYLDFDDVVLNQKLVNTYGKIAKSDAVLKKTMENFNMDMDVDEFSKMVSTTIFADTEIIEISVMSKSPDEAASIANNIAVSFIDEIKRTMGTENVKVLDMAEVPKSPAKPEKMLIIIVTGFIGMIMGLFIAFSKEYIDSTIKTPRDVERKLGIQIMGVIPSYEKPKHRGHDRGNNI